MSDVLDLEQLGVTEFEEVELVNTLSNSAKVAEVGKFYLKESKISVDELSVTPLAFNVGRMWFLGNGTKFFCRSDDSKVPVESDSPNYKKQSDSCFQCPKSKWNGKKPPECKEFVEVLFANLSDKGSKGFKMTFRSSAYKDALLTLSEMGEMGGASRHRVNIKSQQINTKKFSYYIPTFHSIEKLKGENENKVKPLRDKHTNVATEGGHLESEYEVEDFNDGTKEQPESIDLDFE